MTRVAVVDLGTNATRLLVADVTDGELFELDRRLTITRLGEHVDADRVLLPAAMARVEDCVAGYVDACERHHAERRIAFATSAVRDAANGREFLGRLERRFGLETRLLTGEQEARLTFAGATAGRERRARVVVVDLGGGSTELAIGRPGEEPFATSLPLGCVRLTERFLHGDPPGPDEVEALERFVAETSATLHLPGESPELAIGVAGTVTTLAAIDLGLGDEDPALVHGHVMPLSRIDEHARRLASLPRSEIARIPAMHPGRAPVIAAGALALAALLAALDVDVLEVSERDVLHGVALQTAHGR